MMALGRRLQLALSSSCCSVVVGPGGALWSSPCHPRLVTLSPPTLLHLCTVAATSVARSPVAAAEKKVEAQKNSEDAGAVRNVFRLLNKKELKELRAFAHQQKKDIVIQHVGKFGVTPTVVKNLSDALEANELIKVRILTNCPEVLEEMQLQLEQRTEAQVLERIGNTVLLYRPSLSKLAIAEKRDLHRQRMNKRK